MRSTVLPRNRQSRRPGGRRGLVSVLLTACALAISCATAQGAGYVQIVPRQVAPVNLSQLPGSPAFDVVGRSYRDIISAPTGAPHAVTVTGYSVAALLRSLGIKPSSFTFAEVRGSDGRSVLLTYAQAALKGAYPDGPPVAWEDGSGAHFLVPSLAPGGAYAGETFTGPNDTITIALHSGTLLSVGISASSVTAVAGKRVSFTSAVGATPAAGSLVYGWSFGDGKVASAPSVSHAYRAPGTYRVYLRVSGGGDSVGISAATPIVVGHAAKGPRRQGAGTSHGARGSTGSVGTGGSGTTTGAKTSGTRSPGKRTTAPAQSAPPPQAPVTRPPQPTGPLLSGIAVADVTQPAAARRGAGGGAQAGRTGRLGLPGRGPAEGLWIALGALAMLLGGAFLEWKGPPRAVRGELYG